MDNHNPVALTPGPATQPCVYLHTKGPRLLCTSLDSRTMYPGPHECGKGNCLHYRKFEYCHDALMFVCREPDCIPC